MSNDNRLEQLERTVQRLSDRLEILDCISRYSRGCDRFDAELVADSFHEDGVDEHGFAVNPGKAYGEYANAVHAGSFQQNMHNITTHTCEIDGDVAHAESYAVGLFLDKEGKTGSVLAGRYIDRLERRDGVWKLVLRRSTLDVLLSGDASMVNSPLMQQMGYLKGQRDKSDVSYARPLTQEGGARW